jgi:hypothetical protein
MLTGRIRFRRSLFGKKILQVEVKETKAVHTWQTCDVDYFEVKTWRDANDQDTIKRSHDPLRCTAFELSTGDS